jgi:hypothetical protein
MVLDCLKLRCQRIPKDPRIAVPLRQNHAPHPSLSLAFAAGFQPLDILSNRYRTEQEHRILISGPISDDGRDKRFERYAAIRPHREHANLIGPEPGCRVDEDIIVDLPKSRIVSDMSHDDVKI